MPILFMEVKASGRLKEAFQELRDMLVERYDVPADDELVVLIEAALREETDEAYKRVASWLASHKREPASADAEG